MNACRFGFRIVGDCREARRLVCATAVLAAYCACDRLAQVEREAYLSAFQFDGSMRDRADAWQRLNVRDFPGACWAPWIWFDIDREQNIDGALFDARKLSAQLVERYALDGDDLLLFWSGNKGFHVGVPTSLIAPAPSPAFHQVAKRFALTTAERCRIAIDENVFDKVRAFRAPNSRHPKTGLHKRRLSFDELMHLRADGIQRLAVEPLAFELPSAPSTNSIALDDWRAAEHDATSRLHALDERKRCGEPAKLHRETLDFLRNGANTGERHHRLYKAAANLFDFGASVELVLALLWESARDSGLPPKDIERFIRDASARSKPQ